MIEGQTFTAYEKGIYHLRVDVRGFHGALAVTCNGVGLLVDIVNASAVYDYAVVLAAADVAEFMLAGEFSDDSPCWYATCILVKAL